MKIVNNHSLKLTYWYHFNFLSFPVIESQFSF